MANVIASLDSNGEKPVSEMFFDILRVQGQTREVSEEDANGLGRDVTSVIRTSEYRKIRRYVADKVLADDRTDELVTSAPLFSSVTA
jgi:phosphoenolpyruvate synthase/pyruvate phosphate dikinase